MSTAQDVIDRVGAWALIYEGFVLGLRQIWPELRYPPAISQLVWALPRPVRYAVAVLICGYLFWHFAAGPRRKPPLLARASK